MGIPMYREPSPSEARACGKGDPSATARSAIRRQATTRRSSRSSIRPLSGATFRSNLPRQLSEEINREIERRHTRSPALGLTQGEDALLELTGGSIVSDSTRREAGQRILRDALRHGHPGRRLRIPRESTLRFEVPSPLWAMGELSNRSPSGEESANTRNSEHPPFTPRFAPAFAYHSTISSQPHPDISALLHAPGLGGSDDSAASMPLLRRVGHRSVNGANSQDPHRRSIIDGLGDRERSFSPDDDQEHDAWETLLTTITPDVQLPSADSSFTSAAASASTGASRNTTNTSTNSSHTLPSSLDSSAAMHMILDPYPELLNPCDWPSSDSDTEAEPDLSSRPSTTRYRRHRLLDSLRRPAGVGSTQDSQPPIPAVAFSFSQETADPDLQQMQAMLNRLVNREDIPDDWWAAAGLSRTMGRRLGAGDELPRTDIPDGPL
ncbi:hypothetical protein DTO166G4_2582 [Paecilomyces variotii]|nr:hypothetical protein DTO166G4_2582 [Paecilomyces variotii]KAJ9240366.1 hypothetical protein DTO166G5_1704 [Paecilomyces variotii]